MFPESQQFPGCRNPGIAVPCAPCGQRGSKSQDLFGVSLRGAREGSDNRGRKNNSEKGQTNKNVMHWIRLLSGTLSELPHKSIFPLNEKNQNPTSSRFKNWNGQTASQ
jgi:hypothetical protein